MDDTPDPEGMDEPHVGSECATPEALGPAMFATGCKLWFVA